MMFIWSFSIHIPRSTNLSFFQNYKYQIKNTAITVIKSSYSQLIIASIPCIWQRNDNAFHYEFSLCFTNKYMYTVYK